jgi:putative transposase
MDAKYNDLPDGLWELIRVWIPQQPRNPRGGQQPVEHRRAMAGIIYRLRTGCQWDAIPAEFGSGSTCYRRFQEWRKAGVFAMAHELTLRYYDRKVGLDWEWTSLDSASVKAPKGGTSPAPTRPIAQSSAQNGMS